MSIHKLCKENAYTQGFCSVRLEVYAFGNDSLCCVQTYLKARMKYLLC